MTNKKRIIEGICGVTDTIKRITRYFAYCQDRNEKQFIDDMLFSALDVALKLPDMMVTLHNLVYSDKCTYSEWCADMDKYLSNIYGTINNNDSWLTLLRNDTFHRDMIDSVDEIEEKIRIQDDYLLMILENISGDKKATMFLRAKVLVIFLLVQKSFQNLLLYNIKKMDKQCLLCSQIFEESIKIIHIVQVKIKTMTIHLSVTDTSIVTRSITQLIVALTKVALIARHRQQNNFIKNHRNY